MDMAGYKECYSLIICLSGYKISQTLLDTKYLFEGVVTFYPVMSALIMYSERSL